MDLGDANLKPIQVLGEGTFGRVFLCKSREGKDERDVCVKRIIVQNPRLEMGMIQEEVYIISQLRHPHIVQFIRSFVHVSTVNIVMEYLNNGTMRDVINRTRPAGGIAKSRLRQYFLDMLLGLEYLHLRRVTHRDIKPENLLLDARGRIKFADFGISGVHYAACKQVLKSAGTPLYAAPEVLRNERFEYKSDIWSLGCVLYEMCIGQNPFSMATNLNQLRYLMRILTRPLNSAVITERHCKVLGDICRRMLTFDLQQRISLADILSFDPWITLPFYARYFQYDY